MFCYRRRGHNEADEPAATQPMMYQVINKKRLLVRFMLINWFKKVYLTALRLIRWLKNYRSDLEAGNHVANALVL